MRKRGVEGVNDMKTPPFAENAESEKLKTELLRLKDEYWVARPTMRSQMVTAAVVPVAESTPVAVTLLPVTVVAETVWNELVPAREVTLPANDAFPVPVPSKENIVVSVVPVFL